MKTSAKVVLDSVSPLGARLTTLQLVYPRFVHSEFMTHRMFSRNASSSRAIPIDKMIKQVRNDHAMPIHWGVNKPGMQAGAELRPYDKAAAVYLWKEAASHAANTAEAMQVLGLHKQVVNRILEPFQWMHTIVTATEWDNFFKLRLHPAADPNIFELARVMKEAMDTSAPVERDIHLPYIELNELHQMKEFHLVSAARCARVSYLNHDGSAPDWGKDLALAKMLADAGHASPFEHAAVSEPEYPHMNANFRGWKSFRSAMEI